MEKAIEIKRRAQRCILNGDLDGALNEYEKLVASGDSDPYHSVLLADLLYKKGDHPGAARRYLEAVDGYERSGLVKNAIAVCKKMSRLSLSPANVLLRLAGLHALDGLATESSLYYMQHAELVLRSDETATAIDSLHLAFQVCPDNVKALERLAEVQERAVSREEAAQTMLEASSQYERLGQLLDARRCQSRADQLEPGISSRPRTTRERVTPAAPAPAARPAATGPVRAIPGARPAPPVPSAPPSQASLAAPSTPAPPPEAAAPPPPAEAITNSVTRDTRAIPPFGASSERDRDNSPSRPGLAFAGPPPAGEKESPVEEDGGLPEVSRILNEAQVLFQTGQHDAASSALVRAAQAYDRIGHFENAAAIYRNLSQATKAPLQVMMLWLKNCQRRDDRAEAARVACELGDRALKDGDSAGAREWFERARAYDQGNKLAQRRLERLNAPAGEGVVATVAQPAPAPPSEPAAAEPVAVARAARPGFVEVMVGGDTVDFDLGALIVEFQRNLEVQLAADAQGHYDLGMSYREMGLLNEAIRSFELAAADTAFRVRSSEMIGRSMLDQGDFDGAVTTFRAALELSELDPRSITDVRYQLALALEAAGRMSEALLEFEQVYAATPNYPHVAAKIRTLRKALERD